jgi:hypothetical protein
MRLIYRRATRMRAPNIPLNRTRRRRARVISFSRARLSGAPVSLVR